MKALAKWSDRSLIRPNHTRIGHGVKVFFELLRHSQFFLPGPSAGDPIDSMYDPF